MKLNDVKFTIWQTGASLKYFEIILVHGVIKN